MWKTGSVAQVLILSFLVVGCGHVPLCSANGISFLGQNKEQVPGWTCDNFQEYVGTIRETFDKTAPEEQFKAENFDKKVAGYTVEVSADQAWYSERHQAVIAGFCNCQSRYILVSSRPFGSNTGNLVTTSVLAHELAHAVENCYNKSGMDGDKPGDPAHYKWSERGIYVMIEYAHQVQWEKSDAENATKR